MGFEVGPLDVNLLLEVLFDLVEYPVHGVTKLLLDHLGYLVLPPHYETISSGSLLYDVFDLGVNETLIPGLVIFGSLVGDSLRLYPFSNVFFFLLLVLH